MMLKKSSSSPAVGIKSVPKLMASWIYKLHVIELEEYFRSSRIYH